MVLFAGKSDGLNFHQRTKVQLRRNSNNPCGPVLAEHVRINLVNLRPIFDIRYIHSDADNAIKA